MKKCIQGFTLLEMALALFISALLLGGLLPALSGRVEQQRLSEARAQLEEIRQAAIGYAIANGRLPCPASAASNGEESYAASGNAANGACSNPYDGYAPTVTLGIANALDPWGSRIRYAVSLSNSNAWTRTGGIADVTTLTPNLLVCDTAIGISASACASGTMIASGVPLIIYSTGGNGAQGGISPDEAANPNPNSNDNNRTFVSHAPSAATSAGGAFDDVMIWLSPNVLYARMAEAGKLP
ncbi:MAG: type II secretion system GspH family protein [Gallionellaceae bacterium]|nr:type II secretion system GspH family protein [Gallionellaceae bacterium]